MKHIEGASGGPGGPPADGRAPQPEPATPDTGLLCLAMLAATTRSPPTRTSWLTNSAPMARHSA